MGAGTVDVAVLGAGPAGLAAGLALARRHRSVVVLEAADRVGGLAASIEVGGLRVDLGSHRLHPAIDPASLAELAELLGGDLQQRPRNGQVHLAGQWLAFPLRPADLLRQLPPSFAAAAGRDAVTAPLRRPAAPTFAEEVRAGLGPTMLERFYAPYARKLWGVGPDRLDADLARRRVSANSAGAILSRLARGGRPGAGTFWYPRRGFGQLAEALADAAVGGGAEVRLRSAVRSVAAAAGGGWSVVAGDSTWTAGQVWSTLPLPVLAGALSPAPPPEVREALDGLTFRAMVFVYLVLDTPRYRDVDAHYLPDEWVLASRVSEPRNYRDSAEDLADRTVLCAEVPCSVGDAAWTASAVDLGARVAEDLVRLGLPAPPVAAVEVVRVPRVYPIHDLGYASRVRAAQAWLDGFDGLRSFGRQGLHVPDNTHHVLAMAHAAAAALDADGRPDVEQWATARAGFAAHVVED